MVAIHENLLMKLFTSGVEIFEIILMKKQWTQMKIKQLKQDILNQ